MHSDIGKGVLNSHLGSSPDPCYIQNCVIMNCVIKRFRAIRMLLKHDFAVLRISILGPSQKLTSLPVTCTVANVISLRQDYASLCPGNGIFKMFASTVPFCAIIGTGKKELFEPFSPKFSSFKTFLCNNNDQTCFTKYINICWFQHLPSGPVDVNA